MAATCRRERLDDVAEHYLHFGGVSPINGINRALIAATSRRPQDLPVYFGNRNWEPYVEDTVDDHARQRYSSCGGVHHVGVERLFQLHAVRRGHCPGAPSGRAGRARAGQAADLLRPSAVRRDVRRGHRPRPPAPCPPARGWCSPRIRSRWPPTGAAARNLYSRQVAYAARLVAAAAGYADYDVVWQSRSGPPQVPWLEPDVADHLRLAAAGTKAVIVCPIGFVADHIEVVWDLDHELRAQAEAAGIAFARAATPNADRAIRPAGSRSDRRTALRPAARAGQRPRSGAGLPCRHQRRAVPPAALRGAGNG